MLKFHTMAELGIQVNRAMAATMVEMYVAEDATNSDEAK